MASEFEFSSNFYFEVIVSIVLALSVMTAVNSVDIEQIQRELVAKNFGTLDTLFSFLPYSVHYTFLSDEDGKISKWKSYLMRIEGNEVRIPNEDGKYVYGYQFFTSEKQLEEKFQTEVGGAFIQKDGYINLLSKVSGDVPACIIKPSAESSSFYCEDGIETVARIIRNVPKCNAEPNFEYIPYYCEKGFYDKDGGRPQAQDAVEKDHENFVDILDINGVPVYEGNYDKDKTRVVSRLISETRCPPPSIKQGDNDVFISVGEQDKSYIIFKIPEDQFSEKYDRACSLVVKFLKHGDIAFQTALDGYAIFPSHDENMVLEIGSIKDKDGILVHPDIIQNILTGVING